MESLEITVDGQACKLTVPYRGSAAVAVRFASTDDEVLTVEVDHADALSAVVTLVGPGLAHVGAAIEALDIEDGTPDVQVLPAALEVVEDDEGGLSLRPGPQATTPEQPVAERLEDVDVDEDEDAPEG